MDEEVIYDPMEGKIYDAVSDVEGKFSSEFKKYVEDQNLLCNEFMIHNKYDDKFRAWLFKKEQQPDDVESAHTVLTNNWIMMFKTLDFVLRHCLIQFWRAEEVTSVNNFGDMHFILTTRNQPFLISGSVYAGSSIDEGICRYWMKIVDIVVRDGGGGVIGRVFRNKRPEFTPNIHYYSDEEHPLRDLALSCNIDGSLAIPLSDPSGCSVGVLEIVSDRYIVFESDLLSILQDSSSLRYLPHCKDLCGQFDLKDESLRIAVYEIRKIMIEICESCNSVRSETWMLCSHCEFLSARCSLVEEVIFFDDLDVAEYLCTLKKGEGVVGKAAISSHNLVYCEDISQFSITEYPLAHFVRDCDLAPSFAICLKSDLTGSQIYVLEFAFYKSEVNNKGMRDMLVPILEEMRKNFKTFKLASGKEIGDNLSVEVIDARFPHTSQIVEIGELNSVENHVLEMDLIHNGEERGVALALLDQQHNTSEISRADYLKQHNHVQIHNDALVNDVGTLQPPLVQVNDVVHTEKNIVGTSKEGIVNSSKSPLGRGGIDISLEEVEQVSGMKRKDAAKMLNVSVSTFRRVCRYHNISRWPPRKIKIDHLSRSGDFVQTGSTKELQSSAPAVQNENLVTIKMSIVDSPIVVVRKEIKEDKKKKDVERIVDPPLTLLGKKRKVPQETGLRLRDEEMGSTSRVPKFDGVATTTRRGYRFDPYEDTNLGDTTVGEHNDVEVGDVVANPGGFSDYQEKVKNFADLMESHLSDEKVKQMAWAEYFEVMNKNLTQAMAVYTLFQRDFCVMAEDMEKQRAELQRLRCEVSNRDAMLEVLQRERNELLLERDTTRREKDEWQKEAEKGKDDRAKILVDLEVAKDKIKELTSVVEMKECMIEDAEEDNKKEYERGRERGISAFLYTTWCHYPNRRCPAFNFSVYGDKYAGELEDFSENSDCIARRAKTQEKYDKPMSPDSSSDD